MLAVTPQPWGTSQDAGLHYNDGDPLEFFELLSRFPYTCSATPARRATRRSSTAVDKIGEACGSFIPQ
jgi:hypothetical protein